MPGIIGTEDIEKVREATDLVALMGERSPVRQRGRDFWCCCPIHNEKTPSCKIDPALQLWHCFGCGEGGDAFAYVMKTEDLSFPEAVRYLADRAHIEIVDSGTGGPHIGSGQKARLKAVCRESAEFWHLGLMRGRGADADAARAYLGGRGLGGSVPKTWMLGFASGHGSLVRHLGSQGFTAEEMIQANVALRGDNNRLRDRFFNRIMFPICDEAGDVIAFGGRVVGKGEPKYLNSQETVLFHKSSVLYGMDKAKAAMAANGVALVVEGYTDVIALHEAGVRNVVATLGTSLTKRHVRLLSRHAGKRIVYLFDGDEAGQRAADRALQFIDESMTPEAGRNRIDLRAVTLPNNLDPADFVSQRGADELRALVDHAQPLLRFGIERRLARYDLTQAEGRSAALEDALSVLAPIKDSVLAHDYAIQIAGRLRMREDLVLSALDKLRVPRRFEGDGASGSSRDAREGGVPAAGRSFAARELEGASVGKGGASRGALPALGEQERNRLRVEREFLSVLAHYPQLALLHADRLTQVRWHGEVHAGIAQCMIDVLIDDPAADAAAVVSAATRRVPQAAGVLTSPVADAQADPAKLAAYLAEELSIGDEEEALEMCKAQLADSSGLSPEDANLLFQSAAAMQKTLVERKRAHRME